MAVDVLRYIPAEAVTFRTATPARKEKINSCRKPNILVVDDQVELGPIYEMNLAADGFPNTFCTSANEAYQKLKRARQNGDPFTDVVADFRMPGGTGVDLVKRVREDPDPVINSLRMVICTNETGIVRGKHGEELDRLGVALVDKFDPIAAIVQIEEMIKSASLEE